MERSERLYGEELYDLKPCTSSHDDKDIERSHTRRSVVPTYDRKKCLFCNKEGNKRNSLHMEATDSAGIRLKSAISQSGIRGRFVYYAADNIDFPEDTPHDKGTLHCTVMVVYQEKEKSDEPTPIQISGSSSLRSLSQIPESFTEVIPDNTAKGCRPQNSIINQTADCTVKNKSIIAYNMNTDLLWMMAQVISLSDYQESLGEELLHGNCNQSEENNPSDYETNTTTLNAVRLATLAAVYDESVVSNILAGKYIRRAVNAHMSLRLALFKCVSDEFYKEQGEIKQKLEPEMRKLLTVVLDNLMKVIEEQQHFYPMNSTHFPSDGTNERSPLPDQIMLPLDSYSAAVLDGMAQLQALHKPAHVKTCHDLAIEFNKKIEPYLLKNNETHLVFDTYLEGSLKNSTRRKRAGKSMPVKYKITDYTNIQKEAMRSLLSHCKTKDELTAYLANKAILHAQRIKQNLTVSWRNQTRSSDGNDVRELQNMQEANTKIILHSFADKQHPNLLEPLQFGWEKSGHQYSPMMCSMPCAPEWLLNLVHCGCEKGRCAVSCKCKAQTLRCTEICKCGGDEKLCDNNGFAVNEKEPLDS
ncbi:hypothetical protein PR048_013049 [Dryococelus australis]|uniref:Tesmin/TSO1-like CXC domain-containing protein n=1 Tax=Dryococelus australis TaxID=614101 RepID=A0ABQ9HRI6_9NEOP|nr:hypothetical protein PR048_013049 [Dryococelus australis]